MFGQISYFRFSSVGDFSWRFWVIKTNISYHSPIVLKIKQGKREIAYPFKLNATWLEEEEFKSLVKEH